MENVLQQFREIQTEAKKRFQEWKEERWKRENEMEGRRRREDREHERLMMQMILQQGHSQCWATVSATHHTQCIDHLLGKTDHYILIHNITVNTIVVTTYSINIPCT